MDIRREIEKGHNKVLSIKIADYACGGPERFAELLSIFLSGPYRVTQRAAWPLSICAETNPTLLRPHLGKLIKFARRPELHPAVKRNVMRILQFADIPRRYRGEALDLAFGFLENRKEPIAVRAFSMTVAQKLAEHDADLLRELKLILEDEMPFASAGFRSRAVKILAGKSTLPKKRAGLAP